MGAHKEPRWVIAFLRALERTGQARSAAVDAGVDHSTAYVRRRTHADFALAWEAALKAHAAAKAKAEAEAARPSPSHSYAVGPSLSLKGRGADGEELIVSGGKLKRASGERWGPRKEKAFLAELAATGIVGRACRAAGISYEAVRRRRRNDPRLDAACHAAIEACRARIPEFLAGAAAATFDPDALDAEESPLPKVSIDQAIKIAQLKPAGGAAAKAPGEDDYDNDDSYCYEDDIADIREGLVRKLQAMRRRDRPELLARGWSFDESWDCEIPPGWVKGPGWRPKGPDDEVF